MDDELETVPDTDEETEVDTAEKKDIAYLTYEDVINNQSDKAKRYHDTNIRLEIFTKIFSFVFLLTLVLLRVPNFLRDISPFGTGYSPLTIAFVLIIFLLIDFIISLPIEYYAETVERRYEFATRTTREWFIDQIKQLGLVLIIMTILIEAIFVALHYQPQVWWIWAFGGYFIFAGILSSLSPYIISLFTKIEPLEQGSTRSTVEEIAAEMNLDYEEIYRWNMSEQTTKVNAAVTGFGKTIRIMLGDTLVRKFRDDEIKVVMAHEIAHQKHNDVYRGILFSGIISLVMFIIVDLGFDFAMTAFDLTGKDDAAAIGYIWLAMMISMEFLGKLDLWYTRTREKAADLVAIDHLRDIEVFKSAFARLSQENLAFPNPSKLEVWWRYSHPPIRDRIGYAENYYQATYKN